MTNQTELLVIFSGCMLCSCVADNPDYDPVAGHKRIFITVNRYQGGAPSSSTRPGQLICEQAAMAAQLAGRWLPWLSYHIAYPVNAIDEVADVGPWYDMKGVLIFADKASLLRAPAAPLVVTELRTELLPDSPIWTGTNQDGTRSSNLCVSPLTYRVWYSEDPDRTGDVGLVGSTDGSWTQAGKLPCSELAHIICIEQ